MEIWSYGCVPKHVNWNNFGIMIGAILDFLEPELNIYLCEWMVHVAEQRCLTPRRSRLKSTGWLEPFYVEYACSPHAGVDFLQLLRLPPTVIRLWPNENWDEFQPPNHNS